MLEAALPLVSCATPLKEKKATRAQHGRWLGDD